MCESAGIVGPKRVVQMLAWRGKFFPIGTCADCSKENVVLCRSIDVSPTYTAEDRCYKCLYRLVDAVEKVASELRAACVGGTYTEKELK